MAKTKKAISEGMEREYVVPLRHKWQLVPIYRRAGKAVKTLKEFVAKHMRISDRDIDLVKIDHALNEELWFRGRKHPPAKIKVKVKQEKGFVTVTLAEPSEYVKFKIAKRAKASASAEAKKKPVKPTKEEEKTDEQKSDAKEKEATSKEAMQDLEKAEHKIKKQKTKIVTGDKAPREFRMTKEKI